MPLTRIHKLKISENVPEKYEESEYDGTVDKLFQRIVLLMKISGIFVESRSSSKAGVIWHFSCWIYCVLLASMFLADSGRFMLVYKTEEYQKLSNRAMGVYSMTVFTWVMPVMSIGNLYLLTKHVPMILEALSSYDTNYSFEVNKRTLNRTRKRMVYGIAIHSLFGTVFLGLLLTFLPEGTIIMTMLVGFQYSNYTQKIVPIVLMSFKVMILTIGMSASSAFNHWLMKLIKSEYSKVTSRLTSLIQEKSFQEIEEHVEDLRKQHEALTALLQTANPVLQFAVLLSYASGIPVVCFLLYGLADGGLGVMDTFVLLEMFMGSLMSIIYLTLMGATLNSNVSISVYNVTSAVLL